MTHSVRATCFQDLLFGLYFDDLLNGIVVGATFCFGFDFFCFLVRLPMLTDCGLIGCLLTVIAIGPPMLISDCGLVSDLVFCDCSLNI